jgi:hypothetical protein
LFFSGKKRNLPKWPKIKKKVINSRKKFKALCGWHEIVSDYAPGLPDFSPYNKPKNGGKDQMTTKCTEWL